MPDNYFDIVELILFFITFPFLIKIGNSINYTQIFKKGKTTHIQIFYIIFIFIISYFFSHAFVSILELSSNVIN